MSGSLANKNLKKLRIKGIYKIDALFYMGDEIMFEKEVFIKQEYFNERAHFTKMLDGHLSEKDRIEKQSKRNYIFIQIEYNKNRLFIPLRSKLGNPSRNFGKIGFSIPSSTRSEAGLDYGYILIVNEDDYVERVDEQRLPNSQVKIIERNYEIIVSEAIEYVEKYVKCAIKEREDREPLFKESCLRNFHEELGVEEGRQIRREKKDAKKA